MIYLSYFFYIYLGFLNRVVQAFHAVDVHQARKYFRSTRRFMALYKEGATGTNVNDLTQKKRAHREGRIHQDDRRKSGDYDRSRFDQCRL